MTRSRALRVGFLAAMAIAALPGTARDVELPEQLVQSLGSGVHPFEVLAIEVGGNQTITEGTLEID